MCRVGVVGVWGWRFQARVAVPVALGEGRVSASAQQGFRVQGFRFTVWGRSRLPLKV